jgi:hypothetical protein
VRPLTFRRGFVALVVAALPVALLSSTGATLPLGGGLLTPTFRPQLVTVHTPTPADKSRLNRLGLDLTEHAGRDFVEVVLHRQADVDTLRAAGFSWTVRIADLVAREAQINRANAEFARITVTSGLPSGRDTYRTLPDYNAELAGLAQQYPAIVKPVALSRKSLEGKTIQGVEIGANVHAPDDGRPVFAMFGLHHAREWPSGEHSIEFAYDLVENYGVDPRITSLLQQARVIVVPVVNVDGFEKSVNDGMLIDLRALDDDVEGVDGTVSILATPGNAYKRKNCRVVDGLEPVLGLCALPSPGGYGIGVDPNRNYGAFWGGPGASALFADPTYRGAGPFSEPETQAVRELISRRQVTTLITNHTFSNLVLRPNGVAPDTIGPDGYPVGDAPDEPALAALGAQMAAQNGYANIRGWELYDTTGTTEDWSYNSTGGFGYTFEIGPDEFHPPFPEVIDEYLGAGDYAGRGNREAFLIALENAVNPATHSIITGTGSPGTTLRLRKTFATPTWTGVIQDTLDTTMVVGPSATFIWHVNPSTRPVVMSRQYRVTSSPPLRQQTYTGTTPPAQYTDEVFQLTEAGVDVLEVTLDWPTPDDLDLRVFRQEAGGALREVGSSTNSLVDKERALVPDPQPGTYILRVENYASIAPTWTMTASVFDYPTATTPGLIEAWTLSCERNGVELEKAAVVVDRGAQAKSPLTRC